MNSGTLAHLGDAFFSVGWFLPPYASIGFLDTLAAEIKANKAQFGQKELQDRLGLLYDQESLAAMVTSRYPVTPIISDYRKTISEAVEAHFLGLHHVAVGGLIPVVEGACRELLTDRGLPSNVAVKAAFTNLAEHCKAEAIAKQLGATGEVISMLDSFSRFASVFLYVDSRFYPHIDKTNRHGITHGAYKDSDYGQAINFYKTIGAVDFLCFISAFRAHISWFSPSRSPESSELASYYRVLGELANRRKTLLQLA